MKLLQFLAAAEAAVAGSVLPTINSPHDIRSQAHGGAPSCRFALEWSQQDILEDPNGFAWDLLFWEGKFHQNNISYNAENGMTYDGTQLDWNTGERTEKHPFSAASKEALQIMVYAHAIAGSQQAARFLSPDKPSAAPKIAASIMQTKLQTYLRFNETYPGFGGFLPWITTSNRDVSPTWDWANRVPALDNGELIWAVYGFIQALENTGNPSLRVLAGNWQKWLDYVKTTAAPVFYTGNGQVCAVTTIADQSLHISDPKQSYKCEGRGRLDDPYEGELFTNFLQIFGGISAKDVELIWEAKRPQLVSVDYHMGGVGPITVEKGYWFSSHEPWKVLEMPYYDIDIVRRVYHNHERVRTCNSVVTNVPGLFASVNNSTDVEKDTIISYISAAGIPSIANQTQQYLDVITPYGAWPSLLFNKGVGLAWWRNMAIAKKMQNPYGSTESTRRDGTLVSALVTWDSKITTVVSLLGGVRDLVRQKMKADGVYHQFIQTTEREYSRVFKSLKGENIAMCLPKDTVPNAGLQDFTLCRA